jgi:hypothetical protein
MIQELRPYNSQTWLSEFVDSEVYQQLQLKYQHVVASHQDMSLLRAAWHTSVYEAGRQFCEDYGVLDATPYYYIKFLLENRPNTIVDLGCGLNIFKTAWPNIIGIDADPSCPCDVFDHFDQDFVAGHANFCDALISINTIHFAPITSVAERLIWVAQLVRPGGRAFVTFNVETWLMYTEKNIIDELFGSRPRLDQVITYIDQQVRDTGLELVVNDWPILRIPEEGTIRDDLDGNVRLVFNCD